MTAFCFATSSWSERFSHDWTIQADHRACFLRWMSGLHRKSPRAARFRPNPSVMFRRVDGSCGSVKECKNGQQDASHLGDVRVLTGRGWEVSSGPPESLQIHGVLACVCHMSHSSSTKKQEESLAPPGSPPSSPPWNKMFHIQRDNIFFLAKVRGQRYYSAL